MRDTRHFDNLPTFHFSPLSQAEDEKVLQSIQTLVRDNIDILSSSKSTEECKCQAILLLLVALAVCVALYVESVAHTRPFFPCSARRERDVEQSILAMAKQAGKIDEDVRVNGCYFSVISVCLSVCLSLVYV